MKVNKELLRTIPKIDEVLQEKRLFFFMESMPSVLPRAMIVDCVREEIDDLRSDILAGKRTAQIEMDELLENIKSRIGSKSKLCLRSLINATGVALHTNLGRANLSERAMEAVREVAGSYSNLEYDLKKGERGSRHEHVERLITKITGAEAAMVVNNNAAATMLCLSALAKGKEVVVSRGELVEIGGSFRIPEIMEESGAILREIGTTNKTRLADYQNACAEGITGAILKVHTSNYRILGFHEEATLNELVELGKDLDLPVIYDMGSGLMVDLKMYGVDEPTVLDAMNTGIDVILFSGDKLLGGPQGGIIAGKKQYIDSMKKHPLARAFRVDKMTLAAMEATFFDYQDIQGAKTAIPALEMITTPLEKLQQKAEKLQSLLQKATDGFEISIEGCKDQIGGGSAPTVLLDGYAVKVVGKTLTPEKIERQLRKAKTPVIVRISHNQIYLSVRTILDSQLEQVANAFEEMGGW